MKHWMGIMVLAFAALASPAMAVDTCMRCHFGAWNGFIYQSAVCVDIDQSNPWGYTWCESQWLDCHNGMQEPCAPHCHTSLNTCDLNEPPDHSPIIIAPHGGKYKLAGADDPVVFDLNSDGRPDRITWTARGSGLKFLAADLNGNGMIDNGSELFGDFAPNGDEASRMNGFDRLAQLDSDSSGAIDQNDPAWSLLLLWEDRNHDGVSQPEEIGRVIESGITRLGVDCRYTGRRDPNGNALAYKAMLWRDGHAAPYYDVYFKSVD